MKTAQTSIPINGQLKSLKKSRTPLIDKVAVVDPTLSLSDNEVITIMGIRGFGKSYFLKNALLPLLKHVVIYDHVWGYPDDDEWSVDRKGQFKKYRGWFLIREWAELVKIMLKYQKKENKNKKCFIVFRPKKHNKSTFSFFARIVYTIGGYYLIIDELADVCTPHWIPEYLSDILRVGRHKNIGMAGLTQRPASVHNMFKSQVTRGFIFRLNLPPDVKYIKDWMGEEMEVIRTLPHFHYIIWDGTRLIKMKPLADKEEPLEVDSKGVTHIGDPKTSEKEIDELVHVVEEIEEEY